MDRISKLAISAAALGLVLAESYFVSGSWYAARWLGPALVVAAAVTASLDRRAVAAVLVPAYIFPTLVFWVSGRYNAIASVLWLAPLLGLTLPDAGRGWRIPARWCIPLVCWVGGVCLTAPIVAARAVDFHWELLFRGRLPTEALGGLPLLTVAWVLHVALLLAVGLLWFDWICGQDQAFLARWVGVPLAASAFVLVAVTCYQMLVDVAFLNPTVYAGLRRASGTLLDSNTSGAVAAAWIGGILLLTRDAGGRWRTSALALAAALWLAVWATGSRTALASASIVTMGTASGAMPAWFGPRQRFVALALTFVLLAGALAALSRVPMPASGPLRRIAVMVPSRDAKGLRAVAQELWDRNQYGVAATRAIAAYPLFGIGVGSFHEMASDFIPGGIQPDNAQNWYRHQLAELGIVGSLGWIVFLWVFGAWLLRSHRAAPDDARPLFAVLVSAALISLLGVPGQDPFVAITWWTFAGWYAVRLSGREPVPELSTTRTRWMWAAAMVVIALFAVGTTQLATGALRVPARLQRLGGEYLYGFYWPEPDGAGREYRWARKKATALVPVTTRGFELTLASNRGDLSSHPLHVTAAVNGRRVIDAMLKPGQETVTASVTLPERYRYALVDTSADDAVLAPPPDGRELAVMVAWRSVPGSAPLPEAPLEVSVSRNPSGPVAAGSPITWTAAATGGAGPHTFQFWVSDGKEFVIAQPWSESPTWTWVPPLPGDYTVQVWVRNAGATTRYDAWTGVSLHVSTPAALTITGLTSSTLDIRAAVPVTWTATAAGADRIEYQFWVESGGGRTLARDWSADNRWTWTPAARGDYRVEVRARSTGSPGPADTARAASISVAPPPALSVSSVVASVASPASVDVPVTWTATAIGGQPPYSYKFFVFDGTEWTVIRDWGPGPSVTFKPPRPGSYRVQAWVRNRGSVASYDAWAASPQHEATAPGTIASSR